MKFYMTAEARTLLALTGKYLKEGETARGELCPACMGGPTGEKAFSIKRENNNVWYRCWRASCGVVGTVPVYGLVSTEDVGHRKDAVRNFRGHLEAISRAQLDFFFDKFQLMKSDLDRMWCRWSPDWKRFSFEVNSPWNVTRGTNLRTFQEGVVPKWLSYPNDAHSNWLGWCFRNTSYNSEGMPILVCEDLISAMKASRFTTSVALMGTSLNLEAIVEINRARKGSTHIMLCLDKDATEKAFLQADRWRFFMDSAWRATPIRCDIKNMPSKEIEDLVLKNRLTNDDS